MRIPLDVVGDIAILKFSRYVPWIYKKYYGWKLLRHNKSIKVILEKTSGFSGVLRTQETKWIAGEKRKDTVHRENDCSFYLDVDETYFSPRLSQDRKIMCEEVFHDLKNSMKPAAKEVLSSLNSNSLRGSRSQPLKAEARTASRKKNPKILVMFAGVSPLPIVLAKTLKRNKISAEIISSELNKKACEYGEKNVRMNKLENYVKVFCGDSRKLCESFSKKKLKFDFVFMLRPNLEETFLDAALKVAHRGVSPDGQKERTTIFYHGFSESEEKISEEILRDVKKAKRKISKLEIRKAGDIGVRKNRYSVKFKVLA